MKSKSHLTSTIASILFLGTAITASPFVSAGGLGATIGGGVGNTANGDYSTVAGGHFNVGDGTNSVVAGGNGNEATTSNSTIGGGNNNTAGLSATVGGGESNEASGYWSAIGGGETNIASGYDATVGGGESNTADGSASFVGGGSLNTASGASATVTGGATNYASELGFVGGGAQNHAYGYASTVAGGFGNSAQGAYATVPGGNSNTAGGDFSFAGGKGSTVRTAAQANSPGGDTGSFVWSDGQTGGLSSLGKKQFIVGANGGFGVNTAPINAGVAMTIAATAVNPKYSSILLRDANSNDGILISSGDATATFNNASFYVDQYNGLNQTRRLSLDASGKLTISNQAYKPGGGSWAASSDSRLKTNVQPLSRALDQMLALKGVTFEYAHPDSGMHPAGTFSGFIAQDVEKVFPAWIGHDNDGYLTVGPQGFEALTVEALRDLKTSQDDRVAKLERDNADLRELVVSQTKAISVLRRDVAAMTNVAELESGRIAAANK